MKHPLFYTSALLLTGVAPLLTGCRNNAQPQPAPIVDGNAAASDPASANLLPVAGTQQYGAPQPAGRSFAVPATRVGGAQYAAVPQTSSESYPAQSAPNAAPSYGAGNSQQNEAYRYNTQQPQYDGQAQTSAPISGQEYDQYSDLLDSSVPPATQPPPPLPADYEQPEAPGPDYLWTPGYWNYASAGYYYVPGTWVGAPYQGALWTPGWWGYVGNRYRWHHGYWGRHVGYYGGVNYGFGFIGFGYQGGYWNGDHFFYNRAVNRVSPRVSNYTYERRVSVVNNTYINNSRTSYYGGPGGLNRGPAPQEFAARREERTPPMQAQIANRQAAEQNRQQFFNANNGRPAMLAASRPLAPDRGITAPPRTGPAQGFANGRPEGFQPNGGLNPNAIQGQRQQFEQGQRLQIEQQRQAQAQQQNVQRQQQETQRLQQQQANVQQRQAIDAQRQQLNVQHQQQVQSNLQQRQNEQQQRQQLDVQRQAEVQANTQRQQQQEQQRNQQQQQRNQQQQRQQLDVQRQAAEAQRQQQVNAQQQAAQQQRQAADAARQQQLVNTQREQQAAQQRVQVDTQRLQQQQQNLQRQQGIQQQREQSMRPAPAAVPRMDTPRAAPAPHVEAPHAAPAPHMEAPHAAPAAPQAHGDHH